MVEFDTNDNGSKVLSVRQDAFPELVAEVYGVMEGRKDVFESIEENSRFAIEDIIINVKDEEGGESNTTELRIISGQHDIDLNDINHMANVLKDKYNIIKIEISASIEREPEDVGLPEKIGWEFKQEETEGI